MIEKPRESVTGQLMEQSSSGHDRSASGRQPKRPSSTNRKITASSSAVAPSLIAPKLSVPQMPTLLMKTERQPIYHSESSTDDTTAPEILYTIPAREKKPRILRPRVYRKSLPIEKLPSLQQLDSLFHNPPPPEPDKDFFVTTTLF